MFNTMVLPHPDYCCTIWGTTSDNNMGKLEKIQNRGMRIILQCHPRTHIADMFSNLKWLSIKQGIMFLTAVLVFKIMHSKTPNYMSHWLVPVSHQYGTRRSTSRDLFVPRSHPNSLTTKGTRLWNQLLKSTYQHYIISHIHKHLHNISAWLHIPSHHQFPCQYRDISSTPSLPNCFYLLFVTIYFFYGHHEKQQFII